MALINTTTSGILGSTFSADGTGALTVQQNGVTLGIFGNQPAFSAYQNTAQTGVAQYNNTKVTFDVEEFDTNSNFTSSRFTPTVAGYYQINWSVQSPYGSTSAYILGNLFKNGGAYKSGTTTTGSGSTFPTSTGTSVVYFNGTTDYVEVYTYGSNGSSTYNLYTGIDRTYFNGILIKAA
jgi:hypothetical protein